jgi:hypothetical protein
MNFFDGTPPEKMAACHLAGRFKYKCLLSGLTTLYNV